MTVEVVRVLREVRAWDLGANDWMGKENERARVKGGRGALYETVWACADRAGKDVRLGRVESREGGLWPVARWIDGDTTLEIVEVRAAIAVAEG